MQLCQKMYIWINFTGFIWSFPLWMKPLKTALQNDCLGLPKSENVLVTSFTIGISPYDYSIKIYPSGIVYCLACIADARHRCNFFFRRRRQQRWCCTLGQSLHCHAFDWLWFPKYMTNSPKTWFKWSSRKMSLIPLSYQANNAESKAFWE